MTTILVVDDNPLDRKVAGRLVSDAGWRAEFAEDGLEAIEKITENAPDAVLTDLQMPGMDGLELVEQIRNQYPGLPVVLITAFGSEELAVRALHAGASSYVPKRNLQRDLRNTLEVVLDAAASARERLQLLDFMTETQSRFVLGYEAAGSLALVSYCQDKLTSLKVCHEAEALRVGTALNEALRNAIDHGNLELSSELREQDDGSYERLREDRLQQSPYRDRRVVVETFVSRDEARYVIRDEGSGFDPTDLPDPTDPENMLKASGRGILLMRAFMDEVKYNDVGNEITLVKKSRG